MKTEVILTSNIVGLGGESDQVKVAAGYARNYLLPHRLAIPVTAQNKRQMDVLRQRRGEREAHELNAMAELAKSLQKLVLSLKVKTGDDGKMFGSITTGMIADEMKNQFDIVLDKRKIQLEAPIKTLGEQEIGLSLHHDVKATLKVKVESLNPIIAPAAEAKDEAPHSEKRGKRRDETVPAEAAAEKKPRTVKAKKAE